MIVYDKRDGKLIGLLPDTQNPNVYYQLDDDIVKNMDTIDNSIAINIGLDINTFNLSDYKIVDGNIEKRTEQEIRERRVYGRILTEEERLLNKLQPSLDEVAKAKNTIEMINLIQEVM